jgi:hypothetical protein
MQNNKAQLGDAVVSMITSKSHAIESTAEDVPAVLPAVLQSSVSP